MPPPIEAPLGAPPGGSPGSRCSGRGCPRALADLSSLGRGVRSSSAVTDTTKPGVQNPHCSRARPGTPPAPASAAVDGEPSTVVISASSACTANTRHERTASPSSRMVHAPHTPCSHPRCVPVSRSPRAGRRPASCAVRPRCPALAVDRERHGGLSSSRDWLPRSPARLLVDHGRRDAAPQAPEACRSSGGSSPAAARLPTPPHRPRGIGPDQRPLRRLGPYRDRGDAEQGDRRPDDPPVADLHAACAAGDGEVAVPAGDLLHGESGLRPTPGSARRRAPRPAPGGLPRAGEELAGRHRPPALWPDDVDLGVERERHGGILRGRVGVGDRAAEGAAVADLEMADQRGGGGEQRDVAADHVARLQRRSGGPSRRR